ncbi:1813_t:CDS:2 [Dentiscutata erythropus]|uniref:1813_t:CDS:1 n=1 Tax=Dentiscutata erythropus TaxID=1348616 RepID=A0A9N9GSM8_9GLOM|nr:1813_t:CDS:2 [Dentiscutata erythropus]
MYAASPVNSVLPQNIQRPSVATSFLYKLTEIAAYTSAVASEAYYTLTSSNGKLELEIPIPTNKTYGSQEQNTDGNAMQISNDNSEFINTHNVESNDNDAVQKNNNNSVQKNNNNSVQKNDNNVTTSREINFGVDKKDQCSWTTNDNEEEPPPPYDISWSMPTHNNEADQTLSISTHNLSDAPTLSSSPKNIQSETPQTVSPIDISSTSSSTPAKRKQIRVRRPRRLPRRKSSSTDILVQPKESKELDDQDAFISKINEKLIDMIARGKAALKSTVYVTDADVMLAEEKEREDRIMKELGLQTPMNRRGRRLTCSFSDYDYFGGSISDFSNYSAPESSSYCNYGYGSSNSYSTPMNRRGGRLTCSFSDYDYFGGSISDFSNYSASVSSPYCDYVPASPNAGLYGVYVPNVGGYIQNTNLDQTQVILAKMVQIWSKCGWLYSVGSPCQILIIMVSI